MRIHSPDFFEMSMLNKILTVLVTYRTPGARTRTRAKLDKSVDDDYHFLPGMPGIQLELPPGEFLPRTGEESGGEESGGPETGVPG